MASDGPLLDLDNQQRADRQTFRILYFSSAQGAVLNSERILRRRQTDIFAFNLVLLGDHAKLRLTDRSECHYSPKKASIRLKSRYSPTNLAIRHE